MAYNNREWDRGKDSWEPSTSWDTREDYYNDGKRRKYNNGGYDAAHGYEEAGYEASYAPKPGQSSGPPGGFGGKKRIQSSEPTPHIIFLGLDPDFTEADLQAFLSGHGCAIETVTIIRERASGTSKGFGFAQFPTTEHARAFLEPHFPFVHVPPPASLGATATTQFYKALEAGAPHNGRRVKIDFSQSATHDKGRPVKGNVNDGTRDIGNSQHSVLLFRGLDPLSGPQAIHQAMRLSSGVGKDGAIGMKRIILIKDKTTLASCGFAFVEFVDAISAATVLAATMSPQIHPNGFRISDVPVAASFANPDSFQIIDAMHRDETSIVSSVAIGGMDGAWAKYWDETSTIAVLEFQNARSVQPVSLAAASKEKKDKKKKDTVRPAAPAAPSTLPVSSKPVVLSFGKGAAKANPTTLVKPVVFGFSGDGEGSDGEEDVVASKAKLNAKRVAPLISSKKTVNNINKWNQVQEELSTGIPAAAPAPLAIPATIAASSSSFTATPTEPQIAEQEFEFSDVVAMSCLLCSRQFKSMDQLKRHNQDSDLHKKNFKDPNLRDVARQKASAKRAAAATAGGEQPKYRDRASERRVLFNQPDIPLPEKDAGLAKAGKKREAPEPAPAPPPPVLNPGQDENNVGNKLLKMMGWKEGTGLGSAGEGRIEPIKTAVYAEGVGLGASKGKDATKYTDGYSGYVSMAQDAARERYSNS